MNLIIVAIFILAYLLVGYIIGVCAFLESQSRIPFAELSWGMKVRRFILYPVSVYWSEATLGLLEGHSIILFSTFLWPLRYLPITQVLFRDVVFLPLAIAFWSALEAVPRIIGWIIGKVIPKSKLYLEDKNTDSPIKD